MQTFLGHRATRSCSVLPPTHPHPGGRGLGQNRGRTVTRRKGSRGATPLCKYVSVMLFPAFLHQCIETLVLVTFANKYGHSNDSGAVTCWNTLVRAELLLWSLGFCNGSLGNNGKSVVLSTYPHPLRAFLGVFPGAASRGTPARSRSHTSPPHPSVLGGLFAERAWERSGSENRCVCSFPSLRVQAYSHLQAKSTLGFFVKAQRTKLERKKPRREAKKACCGQPRAPVLPQPRGDISYQPQLSFPKRGERAPGQMRARLGQREGDRGLLMCNEAEPKNLPKTKDKPPGRRGASEAAPNPLAATMGTRHIDDMDVTGTLLDKSRFSFAVQPNPKPGALSRSPHRAAGRNTSLVFK